MNLNPTAKASEKNRGNRTITAENARFRKKAVTGTRIFQDRLVMTASITLRINYLYIIHDRLRIVKMICQSLGLLLYIPIPLMKSSKQFGAYLSGIEMRIPSICRKRALS